MALIFLVLSFVLDFIHLLVDLRFNLVNLGFYLFDALLPLTLQVFRAAIGFILQVITGVATTTGCCQHTGGYACQKSEQKISCASHGVR